MEAHLYEELARQEETHWWFRGRRAVIRGVLERYLPPAPRRILDVGCGTGGMLGLLREFGEVEGLESSDDAIRLCTARLGADVVIHRGLIPDDLPTDRRYDVVTAFDVLEHVDDPVRALKGIREVLTPNGRFVCAVPAFRFLWSAHDDVHHHRRRYTASMLRDELSSAGFDLVFSSYFNTVLFPPIAAARLVGKVLPRRKKGDQGSDLQQAPRLVNAALATAFAAERFIVPRVSLPVGVSIIAVGRRRATG